MAKIPSLNDLHKNNNNVPEENEEVVSTETDDREYSGIAILNNEAEEYKFAAAARFFGREETESPYVEEEKVIEYQEGSSSDEIDSTEIEEIVSDRFTSATKITKKLSESKEEIVDSKSIKTNIKLGGDKMSNKPNNIYEKHGIILVPAEIEVGKVITDEEMKAFSNDKFEKEMLDLIGSGKSELSGRIEIHVPAVQIENAIVRIIRSSCKVAAESGIDIYESSEKFISNIVGLTKTVLRDGLGKQTIKSFAEDIYETLLQTGMEKSTAEVNAINMASSYIGKDVFKLKNSSAGLPAEVLTLVVNADVVPDEEDATFNLIIKGLINPIRSISDGDGTVKIALALDKIMKIAQGTFKSEELMDKDVKFDTATLKAESGILTKVVYTVIKQGR